MTSNAAPPVEPVGIGFDFGTTNSSLALATRDGTVRLVQFPYSAGLTESYRSLLYLERHLERHKEGPRSTIRSWSGPVGIDRYLEADEKGRLVQSLKSFFTSRSLQSTEVFGRRYQLEDLVANIMRDIRLEAERQFGFPVRTVMVGRPVRFVGSETAADDDYAVGRLQESLRRAGFDQIRFEFEPVAAASYYEAGLSRNELILIGDFGGGTSDISLLRVGPGYRDSKARGQQVLGNEGLALAGDAFDARIIRHLVSPELGAGTLLKSNGKLLPVPNWVYYKLERWHHLSLLRSKETIRMLESVARQAVEPDKLAALLYLVRHDLGYQLHRAVQRVKVALSQGARSSFRFLDGNAALEAEVTRSEFESWIADDLALIDAKVEMLMARTGVSPQQVDRVFLTGGSSLVPAVKRLFEARFGAEKIRTGDEFTSVAHGLALLALQ